MLKILMLEDDEVIAKLLVRFLSQYAQVTHLIYPLEALELLDEEKFDIIILDLTLPQLDGLEVCKLMRKVSSAKIIISSARSDINDKLFALENGADDYLPKPYDPRELYARIKILHARQSTLDDANSKFKLDTTECTISYEDKILDLTMAEYQIMQLFLENKKQAFSRSDIANSVNSHRFDSGLESINVLVGRLRKKVEPDYKRPVYIKTVRGLGYKFDE
ncbi:MAG: DNA-binding response regulator [uncultured Sulfurovum sp.]|uniref:DNA-binding response regulator n=1 Tax=uncultured Sulfurovum sp. TaxID=269237 RepID=A0A6S6UD38_9BACT|nr:MAG: DNA-binding response regulator [uncultured Sulfurovum sp.]